jgi:hypothetical protein
MEIKKKKMKSISRLDTILEKQRKKTIIYFRIHFLLVSITTYTTTFQTTPILLIISIHITLNWVTDFMTMTLI